MKKRFLALTLCVATALSMAACGNSDSNTVEGTESVENETEMSALATVDLNKYDLNVADYVTLCDYSAIPVTLTDDYEVGDADAQEYFQQMFDYYGPFYTVDSEKTTIEEGDIVNVDYVGTLDGVAFDGGAAENQNIDVSNNAMAGGATTFIEGFTTGLMGASVGDVVACDVTFPEDYQQTDLAGQAVVFTFTVNSIQKEMTIDDVDDAFALEQFQANTVEEMYEQINTFLVSQAESSRASAVNTAIQNYLLENCTVEIPDDYFTDRFTAFENMFITQNCDGDPTQLEEFLSTNYGYTVEQFESEFQESLRENIELEFIMGAIADAEGIAFDQEGFDSYIASMVSYNGVESADVIYDNYGYGDAVYGEAYMKRIYVVNLALDQLQETAVITVEEETTETEEAASTEEVESTEE